MLRSVNSLINQFSVIDRESTKNSSYCLLARSILISTTLILVTGCSAVAVADAAASTVATGAKITVKAVGAVADVVIPDSKDKNSKDKKN